MGELVAVYLFGSVARGDRDAKSDLDILAVVSDGKGKVEEEQILVRIPTELSVLETSISWYGRQRLGSMFRNGELFGWHLYQEAIPLFEVETVIRELGRPAPYRDAVADVVSFQKVLADIPEQILLSPDNAVYELGLVYVCLRNICMAASYKLCGEPDFSRYSPFRSNEVAAVTITRDEYDLAMSCRMAGQRGLLPPSQVSRSLVVDIHARLLPWIAELLQRLEAN